MRSVLKQVFLPVFVQGYPRLNSILADSYPFSNLFSGKSLLVKLYGFDGDESIADDEFSRYLAAIRSDKKKSGGSVKFVLMEGQGRPVLMPLDEDTVRSAVIREA